MIHKNNLAGFSLVEVLIVIAIIAILGVLGIQVFYQSSSRLLLDNDSQLVLETLTKARQYALSSKNKTSWGVHFTQDEVTLFDGAVFNPSNPSNVTLILSSYSTTSSISLGGGADAIFNQLDGSVSSPGYVIVSSKKDVSIFKVISIQSSGIINVSGATPSVSPS